MLKIIISCLVWIVLSLDLSAQVSNILGEPFPQEPPRRMFYSSYYETVREELFNTAKKHATYSFLIANASTPGLNLLAFLSADDRAFLLDKIPPGEENVRSVIIEYVMAAMAENSRRLEALTAVWASKAKSLKNVVTLGK